jgi:hypothetical protein
MTDSPPIPEPTSPTPPVRGKRFFTCLVQLLLVAVVVTTASVCVQSSRARSRRFLAAVRAEHGGRIAWIAKDRNEVRWVELENSSSSSAVKRHTPGGKPVRVAWSSSGETLFIVVEFGSMDHVHRIDAVDRASGASRTILDLGTQNLEDNDIHDDDFWVAPFGDAEAEVDRITFGLGKGLWYSVEAKRPRVRPEAGPPARKWDQTKCPDGKHRLKVRSNDDDSWLELTDGDDDAKITTDDVRGEAAWWVAK